MLSNGREMTKCQFLHKAIAISTVFSKNRAKLKIHSKRTMRCCLTQKLKGNDIENIV